MAYGPRGLGQPRPSATATLARFGSPAFARQVPSRGQHAPAPRTPHPAPLGRFEIEVDAEPQRASNIHQRVE